jgi:hypothetical protein
MEFEIRRVQSGFRSGQETSQQIHYEAKGTSTTMYDGLMRELVGVGDTPKEARDCLKLNMFSRLSGRTVLTMLPANSETREFINDSDLHPFLYFAAMYQEQPQITNGVLDAPDQFVGYAKTVWEMEVAARKLRAKYMRIYRCTAIDPAVYDSRNDYEARPENLVWESEYIRNLRHISITAFADAPAPAQDPNNIINF